MNTARLLLGFFAFALIVGVPFWYRANVSTNFRNFRVVEPGQMYRSGRLSPGGLDCICREYGIKTIVNLRDTKDGKDSTTFDDQDEHDYCNKNKIAFHRLPSYRGWSVNNNGENEGERSLKAFFDILNDPKTQYPVLVHCFAGIHRTGAHIAAYRLEVQGWTPQEALAELQSMGTARTTYAQDLLTYISNYTPRFSKRRD